MTASSTLPSIYQLRVVLRGISPLIWRRPIEGSRILLRSTVLSPVVFRSMSTPRRPHVPVIGTVPGTPRPRQDKGQRGFHLLEIITPDVPLTTRHWGTLPPPSPSPCAKSPRTPYHRTARRSWLLGATFFLAWLWGVGGRVRRGGAWHKPRHNIIYLRAERSRSCWTNVTHRIYTCWLSRFEGPL